MSTGKNMAKNRKKTVRLKRKADAARELERRLAEAEERAERDRRFLDEALTARAFAEKHLDRALGAAQF